MQGPIVFVGLLPLSEDGFPGYTERATVWNQVLATRLGEIAHDCSFVDVLQPLAQIPAQRRLLNDETHLTVEAHRRLAELLLPELCRAMKAAEVQRDSGGRLSGSGYGAGGRSS